MKHRSVQHEGLSRDTIESPQYLCRVGLLPASSMRVHVYHGPHARSEPLTHTWTTCNFLSYEIGKLTCLSNPYNCQNSCPLIHYQLTEPSMGAAVTQLLQCKPIRVRKINEYGYIKYRNKPVVLNRNFQTHVDKFHIQFNFAPRRLRAGQCMRYMLLYGFIQSPPSPIFIKTKSVAEC